MNDEVRDRGDDRGGERRESGPAQPAPIEAGAPAPWGLFGLVLLTLTVAAAVSVHCKQDTEVVLDAAVVSNDAGRNCDSEPNEWRVTQPIPGELDDAGSRHQNLFAIWGAPDRTRTPPEPVGAIFAAGSAGQVAVYDGASWTVQQTPSDQQLTAVWGASPVDVWVAGFAGTVMHYDGQKWTDRSPPLSLFLSDDAGVPTGDAAVAARRNLWGLWVASRAVGGQQVTSAVFAVGDRGTVLHFKDGVWSRVPSGVEEKLTAVWGANENAVFVVGHFGTVLFGGPGQLAKQQTGIVQQLRGVWGRSASDVYVVGVNGVVLHNGSGSWVEIEGGPKQVLSGVWGPPGGRTVYIVGDGTLLKLVGRQGGTFFPFNCVTLHRLESIWGTMVEVPDLPLDDAGVPVDAAGDFGTKSVPVVWVSGVSGTIVTGP